MNKKETTPPKFYSDFLEKYPEVGKKYTELGQAVHEAGPLDEKTRALIKLAISGSGRRRQAFRSHINKARALDISREEIEHVALLSLPTMGFPSTMVLLHMIESEFQEE